MGRSVVFASSVGWPGWAARWGISVTVSLGLFWEGVLSPLTGWVSLAAPTSLLGKEGWGSLHSAFTMTAYSLLFLLFSV